MKKYVLFIWSICLGVIMTGGLAVEAKALNEHQESIESLSKIGVMKGYGNGEFRENEDVTRGQVALMLYRWLYDEQDATDVNVFTDVAHDPELVKAVNTLHRDSVVNGYENRQFKPNEPIRREHIASMFDRLLAHFNIRVDEADKTYADHAAIGSEHEPAVLRMTKLNILKGNETEEGIFFSPKATTTRGQSATILTRTMSVVEGKEYAPPLAPPVPEQPTIEQPEEVNDVGTYSIASIENGKLTYSKKRYRTYHEAKSHMDNRSVGIGYVFPNETYVEDGATKHIERLIYAKAALAYAHVVNDTTIIYERPDFKKQLAYIQSGREMLLLEQHEHYYKVRVGDSVGYTKREQTGIIPLQFVDKRDHYYMNDANELVHYTYNHLAARAGVYPVGPAPKAMKKNVHYYSTDGIHFHTDPHQRYVAFTHYPYFQFLSIRTKTSYTAEELDAYIMAELTRLERAGTLKQATTKSKLLQTGSYLKELERDYRVNALYILAVAIHESNYGMSVNAQTKNNLFGIRVTDQNTSGGTKYEHPTDSMLAFVQDYMNKNYANPLGMYAKGASPGNKTMGVNVHYASDPTWGSKVGAHMWRIDRAIASRDYGQYERGVIRNEEAFPIYAQPFKTSPILFEYAPRYIGSKRVSGYPVAIVDSVVQQDGHTWYKVIADALMKDEMDKEVEYGWVRSDAIHLLFYK